MKLVVVSFKISKELLDRLDKFCKKNNLARSEAIRLGIELLLKKGYRIKPVE